MASSHMRGTTGATGDASHLGRLNDLDEFKVADGYPDIRGWDVRTTDGQSVGTVGDLIVDTTALRVRYLDVEVDRAVAGAARRGHGAGTTVDNDRHTLLPIGNVQLDEKDDRVLVDGYTLEQIAGLPRYGGQSISREYERTLRDRHRDRGLRGAAATGAAAGGLAATSAATSAAGAAAADHAEHDHADHYEHADYDDQRLYAPRRAQGRAQGGAPADRGAQRITLAEEELTVGKRVVPAGEVALHKSVETRHVEGQVATTRDEVTVERRPITDAAQLDAEPAREGEIRIPVMEERLVVEKRLVPVEQIIIRKHAVTEQQTVAGDVRRERVEIDDASARAAGLVRDAGTTAATGTTRSTRDR